MTNVYILVYFSDVLMIPICARKKAWKIGNWTSQPFSHTTNLTQSIASSFFGSEPRQVAIEPAFHNYIFPPSS